MPIATTQNKDVDQAKLLPEDMSQSMEQLQLWCALNSVAQVTTRAHTETLGSVLEPVACLDSGEPHNSRSHTDMGGLYYHLGPECHPGCL
ncbi:hypothetical protein I79_000413 [Cricetulus griseus]|uniref:Uncharacterized protein n=1 Tax=Cricetulus griseus TaxID=10029 RepID=G3GS95_CRIGR|nr:hypothetical protein I79_000413 [Cricetulus griseus]